VQKKQPSWENLYANKGWSDAGITLQAFFLTIATALAFVGFFPVVFNNLG
jgi:hypothetical protein